MRDHVRRECAAGRLAPEVVAVGPWWQDDGQHELDIVALAGRSRSPVLIGEATWARAADGVRISRTLRNKAFALTGRPDDLRYLVAARDHVRGLPDDVIAVTAEDVFAPG